MTLIETMVLATAAGMSIPAGAAIASNRRLRDFCYRHELDSFVSFFGGGALLAAIALVLVPFGMEHSSSGPAGVAFFAGGAIFWQISSWMRRSGSSASQLVSMMLDFIPEAIALGAAVATGSSTAYLLAVLIALQNMPEGFAALREMQASGFSRRALIWIFASAPLAGPVSGWIGYGFLATNEFVLALLMLFCSGGIIYLIFEDIAPGAHLKHRDFPPVGAVSGFLLGMLGSMMVH
ncbi:MAG: divalent cation transporter [Gammaproteobacteria bacterium]|nr:divalent cation transporter [Gammaproteobacteria bacterium]